MNIQDFSILTKERESMVWNLHLRQITQLWTSSEKNNKNMKLRSPITCWIQDTRIAVSRAPETQANLKAWVIWIETPKWQRSKVGKLQISIERRDPLSSALIPITSTCLDSNQEILRISIMINFSITMNEIVMSTSHCQGLQQLKTHL